ncbi:MAG: hypothetical protein ABSB10_02975 [Candidatus Bathyarchaeia archaeon]|jgi:hypothetical protein
MLLVNEFMKQTLLAKLLPTPKQAMVLSETMTAFNVACNERALVCTLKVLFEELWHDATGMNERICEIETENPAKSTQLKHKQRMRSFAR